MYIKIETNCIYNLMINGKYLFIMWYFEFILFFLIPFRLLNYKCNARHAFHAHKNSTIGIYMLESLFSSFDCLGLFRFGFIWWVVVLIVVSFFYSFFFLSVKLFFDGFIFILLFFFTKFFVDISQLFPFACVVE